MSAPAITEPTILVKINEGKKDEVSKLKTFLEENPSHPIHSILKRQVKPEDHPRRFENALRKGASGASADGNPVVGLISEIKRKSPSAGSIGEIPDPVVLAKRYQAAGASCISCLTDGPSFGGCLEDLKRVTEALGPEGIPVLRKDFTIDELQIAEAIDAGASAVLLIVASLREETGRFLQACERMGVCALVEVHDQAELEIAKSIKARMIGVNNRNLHTFQVSLATCEDLRPLFPQECVAVAESGIHTAEDALRMRKAGYDAVLVGESLVRAPHPAPLIAAFRGTSPKRQHEQTGLTNGHAETNGTQNGVPGPTKKAKWSGWVKVCGVKDAAAARAAVEGGASAVGLVFHQGSKRYIGSKEKAKEVALSVRGEEGTTGRTEVWGVFTSQNGEEIAEIAKFSGLQAVQLHDSESRHALEKLNEILPGEVRRIFASGVDGDGQVKDLGLASEALQKGWLKAERDFLLVDGLTPGAGEVFPWEKFQKPEGAGDLPMILAGGLSAENVEEGRAAAFWQDQLLVSSPFLRLPRLAFPL
eukprot:Cvel_19740.t1-p1 / transcript=Cvel_19740.t1 / gene=Cvel_19740 / organism=Chromera_velia_CCMP2878 / gene_product=Indole-3-glycerol phosphate synthase, putative / transcript_product=Indole-3-glycerol phosphate synthase, putative / location=Cvel_scaffold1727:1-3976(-) / protein_length=533 / sequence_SO=supercontig / SO=protein_coding / is_pseudo=false